MECNDEEEKEERVRGRKEGRRKEGLEPATTASAWEKYGKEKGPK